MWKLDHKEGWALKNWCFRTVVLKKTLESPLDSKEIKPVSPKGNQPWIEKIDAETEAPILWPPDKKSQLIGKYPDAGTYWGQEEKGATKDEMIGWHHWLNGREFEQILRDSEEQGSLGCYSPWDLKEWDMTVNEQQKMKYNLIYICTQMDHKNALPILIIRAGFDIESSWELFFFLP